MRDTEGGGPPADPEDRPKPGPDGHPHDQHRHHDAEPPGPAPEHPHGQGHAHDRHHHHADLPPRRREDGEEDTSAGDRDESAPTRGPGPGRRGGDRGDGK